jgi:HK97 gp10 family phage protein
MQYNSQITGMKELEKKLTRLDQSVAPKALRASLKAGGKIAQNAIESAVTRHFEPQTGLLAASIKTKTTLNKKQTHKLYDAAVYVGIYNVRAIQQASGSDIPAAVYAYWLETGVKPHDLNAKSKRSRGKVGQGKNNFHPGIQPQPFIRPALLNNDQQIIDVTRAELKRRIELAIKKAKG